jgi:hypothetical protein
LCKRTAERIGVYVVDETPPAVDLHYRDPLAVRGFELGIAVDRDLPQLEVELVLCRRDDAPGRRAEMAARCGEQSYLTYG